LARLEILNAKLRDIDSIAPLFDAYRVFYKQKSNSKASKEFINDRLSNGQSVILMALLEGEAIGFTQLYTTYSSVSMQPFFILNDLFVLPEHRGKKIGERLLREAQELCIRVNYKGLSLETATDNPAQHLYEKLGWKKDTDYFHYFWKNK
jgi:GNAT superfamily N-acetyltransferase